MRRILFSILSLFIFLIVVALIAPSFMDWNSYKSEIRAQAAERFGYDVALNGDIHLSVLPYPRLVLNDVAVSHQNEAQSGDAFLSFEKFDVNLDITQLIAGKIHVGSVSLQKPIISIIQTSEDGYNFLTPQLQKSFKTSDPKDAAQPTEPQQASADPAESAIDFAIRHINVKDAAISYTDAAGKTTSLDTLNLSLGMNGVDKPVDIVAAFAMQGRSFKINAVINDLDLKQSAATLDLSMGIAPEKLDLNYAGTISWTDGAALSGKIDATLNDAGEYLAQYIPDFNASAISQASLNGDASFASGVLELRNANLVMGGEKFFLTTKVMATPFGASVHLKSDDAFDLSRYIKSAKDAKAVQFDLNLDTDGRAIASKKSSIGLNGLNFEISFDAISSQEAFELKSFNIPDFAGASIDASGKVSRLHAAPKNIDAQIIVDAPKAKAFLGYWGIDASTLPSAVQRANASFSVKGTEENARILLKLAALDGEITVSGDVKKPLSGLAIHEADIAIKHPNMQRAVAIVTGSSFDDPNFSGSLSYQSKVIQDGKAYRLENIKAALAKSNVRGNLMVSLERAKPEVTGVLVFERLVLQSSVVKDSKKGQRQGGGSSSAAAPKQDRAIAQSNTAGRWSTEAINLSGLHAFNMNLEIQAQSLDYGAWPLVEPKMRLSLQDGALKISDLNAGLFGGQLGLHATVKSASKELQPIQVEGDFQFSEIALDKLTQALTGSNFVRVSGIVSGQTKIETSGVSAAAMVYDLSGDGAITGTNLILEGVDVVKFARALSEESKPGDSIMAIWSGAKSGGRTAFSTLDGAYAINEGVVNISKMDLDGAQAMIQTQGQVNLPNWTLATKHKITVKPVGGAPADVPPFEMSFSGSLDNPTQTFGQGLLQDYLNRKIQRKLNDIISDKIGLSAPANDNSAPVDAQDAPQKESVAEEEKPQKPKDIAEEAVKGILKDFLR